MRAQHGHEQTALRQRAMAQYLRKGYVPANIAGALGETISDGLWVKFNPNHDAQGRFTSGPAGGGDAPASADGRPRGHPVAPSARRLTVAQISPIISANNRSGQSDELIMAIAYRETRFDPLAKSTHPRSTAIGLMQVTQVALDDYNKNFLPLRTYEQLTEPATNVSVGSAYLGLVINKYHKGNVKAGLYAYGPGSHRYVDQIFMAEQALKMDRQRLHPLGARVVLETSIGK